MTKKEIFDYIKHTPLNTNFNILSDMLDELVGGGGEGGSNFMVVNFTGEAEIGQESSMIYADELTPDKTLEEVNAAYEAGIPVFGKYYYNLSFGGYEVKLNYLLPLSVSNDVPGAGSQLYFCSAVTVPGAQSALQNCILWSTGSGSEGIRGSFIIAMA